MLEFPMPHSISVLPSNLPLKFSSPTPISNSALCNFESKIFTWPVPPEIFVSFNTFESFIVTLPAPSSKSKLLIVNVSILRSPAPVSSFSSSIIISFGIWIIVFW